MPRFTLSQIKTKFICIFWVVMFWIDIRINHILWKKYSGLIRKKNTLFSPCVPKFCDWVCTTGGGYLDKWNRKRWAKEPTFEKTAMTEEIYDKEQWGI